jgi:hypothetical protein
MVIAEDKRDHGVVWKRRDQQLHSLLGRAVPRVERAHSLVEPEIDPASEGRREHEQHEDDPTQHAHDASQSSRPRLLLDAVDRRRRPGSRWQYRKPAI